MSADLPHSAEICRGWAAKLAAVLPAELRRAFITDAIAGAGGVQAFIDDQPSSFLQAHFSDTATGSWRSAP